MFVLDTFFKTESFVSSFSESVIADELTSSTQTAQDGETSGAMSSGNSRFYLTAEMHDAVDRKSDISGDGSPYLRARRVNRNPSQTSLGSDKGTRELTLHFNFARNVLLIN